MEMDIRDNWDRLSPSTQQWLTDNPGCMILPRTITSIIRQETGGTADRDRHGTSLLSEADRDFITRQGTVRPAVPAGVPVLWTSIQAAHRVAI